MTNPYVITVDSGCDLSLSFCESQKIYPIHMKYIVDGSEHIDSMDHTQVKPFFDLMREGRNIRTVQINSSEFEEFWTPFLEKGLDILYLSMSSGISGTFNSATGAADALSEKFPDRVIKVVDSLMTSTGSGLVAIETVRLRDEGKSLKECAEYAGEISKKVHACFTTDDISYLYRGGRVSYAGMILSKALRIYPVMHVNTEGELKVFAKARGTGAAWEAVAKYITDNCISPETQTLYVSDADNEEGAHKLGEMLCSRFGFKDVFYSKIGSIIGSHTGPGLLTLFFLGKSK